MKSITCSSIHLQKTIFDFCKDAEMIEDLVVSREDFFRDLKEYPLYNAHILIEYAEITNNKKLLRAVLKSSIRKNLQKKITSKIFIISGYPVILLLLLFGKTQKGVDSFVGSLVK